MTVRDESTSPPTEAEVRAALERLVASPALSASPRLASFLRFVVEATLAGEGDRIKEYSIATGALGRNHTFDPKNDPIVRVEAGRLRRALERYYAGPGWRDRIAIEIPRGHYVPMFSRRRTAYRLWAFVLGSRRLIPGAVRQRLRLTVFVAFIAAVVSITFDLAFMWVEHASARTKCQTTTSGLATSASFDCSKIAPN